MRDSNTRPATAREKKALGASAATTLRSTPHTSAVVHDDPPPSTARLNHPATQRLRAQAVAPPLTHIPAPALPGTTLDPGYVETDAAQRRRIKTAGRLAELELLKARVTLEAEEIRALTRATDLRRAWAGRVRVETEWKAAVRREWLNYRWSADGEPRYFITPFEAAQTAGVPDLLALDRKTGVVSWIETKLRTLTYNWPKAALLLGLKPAQAVWLWRWRRNGGRCGVLCGTTAGWWLWVPAHAAPEWPDRVLSPNGWMTVPHVVGSGPVPDPATLWALPTELGEPGGTPSKPTLFDTPNYDVEAEWPAL